MIGSIYRIIHLHSNICYVGSTMDSVRNRWQGHKSTYSRYLRSGKDKIIVSIYPYFKQYGIDSFKCILVKEYEVEDKNHLLVYEQLWINKFKSINTNNAFNPLWLNKRYIQEYRKTDKYKQQCKEYRRTNNYKQQCKEYYESNKDQIKQQQKEYDTINKDKINQRQKEYRKTAAYKQQQKEYRKTDAYKQKQKEYYQANKDKIKQYREAKKQLEAKLE